MYLARLIYNCSVVLFTGNMILGLFWKIIADKTNNPTIIRYTLKGIITSDLLISVPSLVVILALNYYVNDAKYLPRITILLPTLINLITVYSICLFVIVIHPLRTSLLKLVSGSGDSYDITTYNRLSGRWALFGVLELAPLILILLLSI